MDSKGNGQDELGDQCKATILQLNRKNKTPWDAAKAVLRGEFIKYKLIVENKQKKISNK